MSFKVDPGAIGDFAVKLQHTYANLMVAKNYVGSHGDFSLHETGLIGLLSGDHAQWVDELDQMIRHLLTVTYRSEEALRETAKTYAATDRETAARVDASYPATPRAPLSRD